MFFILPKSPINTRFHARMGKGLELKITLISGSLTKKRT